MIFPWENRSEKMDDLGLPPWFGNLHLATRNVVPTTRPATHRWSVQVSNIAPFTPVPRTPRVQSAAEMQSPLPALCQIDLRNKKHGDHSKSHMLDVSNIAASQRLCQFASLSFCHVLICSSSQRGDRSKNHHASADEVVEDAHVPVITCLMIIPIYDKS